MGVWRSTLGGVGEGVSDAAVQGGVQSTAFVRACPVCASVRHVLLYQQRFEDFAAGSITNAYDVVACRDCGMCFASGLPGESRFSEYYGQSSKYDLSAEDAETSALVVQRHRDSAEFIADHLADRDAPVLDIGTATGDFLVALREIGFTSIHGVDPSPEAAARARKTNGLDVIAGDTQEAWDEWPSGFAVVALVMVLEHLVDPGAALRDVARLLRPDGRLYLLVPDATHFQDHVTAPFQEFSVEHINYFTPRSLRNLLAAIGFDVEVDRPTTLRCSGDAEGPAIELLADQADRPAAIEFDGDGVAALRDYISRCTEMEAAMLRQISQLADDQRPIYVWGTGTNALHLLATSRLGECNILAFLDSNPHYHGRPLAGRTVIAPQDVRQPQAPILVASAVSQSAIAAAARKLFGPDVGLILMS
jgi:SAM-dependent methyltransferase